MMIPGRPAGTNAADGAAGSERPSSDAPEPPPTAPLVAAAPALAYADFAAALKDALRDFHSSDLRYFYPPIPFARIPKAITPHDHSGMKDYPIAYATSLSDHYIGVQHAIVSDLCSISQKNSGIKYRSSPNSDSGADKNARK